MILRIHVAKNDTFKNVLIGNNAQPTSGYSTVLGYKAKGYTHSVAIGSDAQANGLCSIAIGSNCINSSNYRIKFWVGASTTISDLSGVDFGNIIFDINDNELTIKNPTIFNVRPTLKNGLSAPTNDNDIVTKKYVNDLFNSLQNS
jgi:hypothetical protein